MSLGGLRGALHAVALFGARQPKRALVLALLLFVAAAAVLPSMRISTSRRDLVESDQPYQAKLVSFHERFGYPDRPAIVVSGASAAERRRVVDALTRELESLPELEGRVLGKLAPSDLAELLLLVDPVSAARAIDPARIKPAIEAGWPGWIGAVNAELAAGLESGKGSEAEAREALEGLGRAARLLDAHLGGAEELDLAGLLPEAPGFDEQGYFVSGKDHHVLALLVALESDEGSVVAPMVERIRAARDRALERAQVPGVRADVTGLPAVVADELHIVERDLAWTGGASGLLMLLTLWWAFRSLRQAMVSFLPLGFGMVVTFGIVRLTLGELNLITASFTSVLLGLGDFGVHIQTRYGELLRRGESSQRAMEEALLKSGPGLLVGTLTTAAAFLATATTDFTAFAQLGFITATGLSVMLLGTYLLIPAVVVLLFGDRPTAAPELPGMRRLAGVVRRSPRAVLLVAAAITVMLAFGLPKLEFRGRYFDFLPEHTESARGLEVLEKDPLTSPMVAHVPVGSFDEARALATALRALPEVASVDSPSDWLPPLDEARRKALLSLAKLDADWTRAEAAGFDREGPVRALGSLGDTLDEVAFALRQGDRDPRPADDAKREVLALRTRIASLDEAGLATMSSLQRSGLALFRRAFVAAESVVLAGEYSPKDLPPLLAHRFVSKDQHALAVYVHPGVDVWSKTSSLAFREAVVRVAPEASGLALTVSEHEAMIVRGFERATIASAVLVLVILFLSFRSVLLVAVAALPLALGSVWMLGAMPALGLSFNHANLVALPLVLGLGVDAGAHVVHRYRQSAAERGGVADLGEVLGGTGSAVLVASLTTVFGMGVLMLAEYRAMYSLGLVMTVGMLSTLVLGLVALPAALVLLKKAE